MLLIFDYLFHQFSSYEPVNFYLEIVAVSFGLISVLLAKNNNIAVYPTGIISTLIFVYLLFDVKLIGDMLINAYYFMMSIYGWYIWSRKRNGKILYPISYCTLSEIKFSCILFLASLASVFLIYFFLLPEIGYVSIIDTFTTAIFFVGMWLMAKKKIENWFMWIIGDLISIPLYFYKGMIFTSLQYIIFTLIAIFGVISWVRIYKSRI